jgi:2-oxo-4-hydroxy-4-carboxy-5-ureidoimidazoline decarboxylase
MTPPATPLGLDGFHALDDHDRLQVLLEVCASPLWARQVLDGAPFTDADAMADRAQRVLDALPDDEIDAALAGHPRIGDRPGNPSSAREQAGVAGAEAAVLAALAAGNRAYEDKFGHVYLVCASGRSAAELLEVLTERLTNDAGTERRVTRVELGKINRLRLSRLLSEPEKS